MRFASIHIEGPVTDDELADANRKLQAYRNKAYTGDDVVAFVRNIDATLSAPDIEGATYDSTAWQYFCPAPEGVDPVAHHRDNSAAVDWPTQGTYLHVAVKCWPGRTVVYATSDLVERHEARAAGPRLTKEWLNPAVQAWANSPQRRTCTHPTSTTRGRSWDPPLTTAPGLAHHLFHVVCQCGLHAVQPASDQVAALFLFLSEDDRNLVLNLVSKGTVSWIEAIAATIAVNGGPQDFPAKPHAPQTVTDA